MANKFVNPAYGIPDRFKTPEQRHQERMGGPKSKAVNSWVPGADFINTLWSSTASSFIGGFAADAKTLDYMFDADITKDAEHSLRNMSESLAAFKPTKGVEAGQKKFIEDEDGKPVDFGEAWSDIYAYADLAGSGLGSIAAMILGGGVLKIAAKGGVKAITNKAIKKKADDIASKDTGISHKDAMDQARQEVTDYATKYDNAIGTGAYGTAESAIVSGAVGQAIEAEVMAAPAEILNQSERFREIYYGFMDGGAKNHDTAHNAARIQLSREAGIEGAKTVSIPSFVLGSVAGRYVDKAISGKLSKSTLKNFAIIEAAEVPTETAQGATEQYVQNKVYKDLIDKTRNVWEGVPDAAVREGLGVAFGAAPLSLISAKAQSEAVKRGEADPVSFDDLSDRDQIMLVDQAARIDEAATDTANLIQDPIERYQALTDIIVKGNVAPPEGGETGVITEPPVDTPIPPESPVEPEIEPPVTTGGPAPGGPEIIPPTEPVVEPPVETPPEDIIPPDDEIVEQPPVETPVPPLVEEAAGLPAHKVNFEAFQSGKREGTYAPEPARGLPAIAARNVGNQFGETNIDEISNLSRKELNAVGRALGIKTAKSGTSLQDAVVEVSDFANLEPANLIGRIGSEQKAELIEMLESNLKEPPPTWSSGKSLSPTERLIAAQSDLKAKADTAYDRQQHRDAIEQAVSSGDFTLEDFNALPETDQKAYADIGRQLRAEPAPETPEQPETPEGTTGEGGTEPPVETPPEETTPAPPETEPPVETPTEPVPPETTPPVEQPPEAPTEETPETPVEDDGIDRDAILGMLDGFQIGDEFVIKSVSLSKEAKPKADLKVTMTRKDDDKWIISKGNKNWNIQFLEDNYYVTAVGAKKRGRKITEITLPPPKQEKDIDTDTGAGKQVYRPHDIERVMKELTDDEKYFKRMMSIVSKANVINSLDWTYNPETNVGVTPGTKRLYQKISGHIPDFSAWIGPHIGMNLKTKDPYTGEPLVKVTFKDAIMAILEGQPLVTDSTQFNIQTRDDLEIVMRDYTELLHKLRDSVNGSNTTKELLTNFVKNEFEDSEDTQFFLKGIESDRFINTYALRSEFEGPLANHENPNVADDSIANEYIPVRLWDTRLKSIHQLFKYYHDFKGTEYAEDLNKKPHIRQSLKDLEEGREGMPDHRKGENISSEQLMDTFGFEGVRIGDHVGSTSVGDEVSEAQRYRNMAYDAFADLAYVTGLPLKAMGYKTVLSIGALGHGKKTGMAFFSPAYLNFQYEGSDADRDAIIEILEVNGVEIKNPNITLKTLQQKLRDLVRRKGKDIDADYVRVIHFNRNNGDGSIAHEWGHNLGDRLEDLERASMNALKYEYDTVAYYKHIRSLINTFARADIEEGFDESQLLKKFTDDLEQLTTGWNYGGALSSTKYFDEAKATDIRTGGDYWASGKELFARAFEAFVVDRIALEEGSNPFLQSHVAMEGVTSLENGYVGKIYPETTDRANFYHMFLDIFNERISTISDKGDIKLNKRPEEGTGMWDDIYLGSESDFKLYRKVMAKRVEQLTDEAILAREEFQLGDETDPFGGEDPEAALKKAKEEMKRKKEEEEKKKKRGGSGGGGGVTGGRKPPPGVKPPTKKPKPTIDLGGRGKEDDDLVRGLLGSRSPKVTRFSIRKGVQASQSPGGIDQKILDGLTPTFSRYLHDSKSAGESTNDFLMKVLEHFEDIQDKIEPYILQYMRDVTNGNINYKEYVDTTDTPDDEGGAGDTDSGQVEGQDDTEDISDPAGEQAGQGDTDGTGGSGSGVAGGIPSGNAGGTLVGDALTDWFNGLSHEQQITWIWEKKGLRGLAVEQVPHLEGDAQVELRTVVPPNDNEGKYMMPSLMARFYYEAMSELENRVIDPSKGINNLAQYVANELGYKSEALMREGLMSLQIEAIGASIYQMGKKRRSTIIADQTGVGKGRQAGAIIHWAIKNGKIPVFVTATNTLYTDMYYDMVDSGLMDENKVDDFFKSVYISDSGSKAEPVGVKDRNSDEDNPNYLFSQTNNEGKQLTEEMLRTGNLPKGRNAMFTTYHQISKEDNPRRRALRRLMEDNDVVLIMDESHMAAGIDTTIPQKRRDMGDLGTGWNGFFTEMIDSAWNTQFLSATYAKRPEHLAFYSNTDLQDAMDSIGGLIKTLQEGGPALQEIVARSLTRNGQMIRREISYEGIDVDFRIEHTNEARDRENVDSINNVVRKLIKTNSRAVPALTQHIKNNILSTGHILGDVIFAAQEMYNNDSIGEDDYQEIMGAINAYDPLDPNSFRPRFNITPVRNQIHGLRDQLITASKVDLAVDEIIKDIASGKKPIIGIDKTNAAMLGAFIKENDLVPGDSLEGMNWTSIMKMWAKKTHKITITTGPKQSDKIAGFVNPEMLDNLNDNNGDPVQDADGNDAEFYQDLLEISQLAEDTLGHVDLPMSPIDYIISETERRARKELGLEVKMGEITGRHKGAQGIDYSIPGKPVYKLVERYQKRDMIDQFNGEVLDANKDKLPASIIGLIINQSGSTGVSLHSSEKHGNQEPRHMTMIDPSGDIVVVMQMLGRIFRTGMIGLPEYTILGSSIPSEARNINIIRKKLESLNAQTSADKEGSVNIDVVDFMNHFGDEAVRQWVEGNNDFQEMEPNWESKLDHDDGFAYWVTGAIGILDFDDQKAFYTEVVEDYQRRIAEADANGTNDLKQEFVDWKFDAREEITLAEPRKDTDGKGFNAGAWLVRGLATLDYNPHSAKEILAEVNKNKKPTGAIADATFRRHDVVDDVIKPDQKKVDQYIERSTHDAEEIGQTIHALEINPERADQRFNQHRFDEFREKMLALHSTAMKRIDRHRDIDPVNAKERLDYLISNEKEMKASLLRTHSGRFTKVMKRIISVAKSAIEEQQYNQELAKYNIGTTYDIQTRFGEETITMQGTVVNIERVDAARETIDPYKLTNVVVRFVVNRPGIGNENGVVNRPLRQLQSWISTPVPDQGSLLTDKETYVKYHETLATKTNTREEWIVTGNTLLGREEMEKGAGKYVQFTDEFGRRLQGIVLPHSHWEKDGIESAYKGNLEIPDGDIITEYFRDHPSGEFSYIRGFASRNGNIRITADESVLGRINIVWQHDGVKKARNVELVDAVNDAGLSLVTLEDQTRLTISNNADGLKIINAILQKSRLIVTRGDKNLLKDYMNVEGSSKATTGGVTTIKPKQVGKYTYEKGITAHRGTYTTGRGKTSKGFYLKGLPSSFNIKDITKFSSMKARKFNGVPNYESMVADVDVEGLPFIYESDFTSGKVDEVLGSPIAGQSELLDGTAFSLGRSETKTKKKEVESVLNGLPFRLKRLVNIVQSESELPKSAQSKIIYQGVSGMVEGVFHEGKIYIIADGLAKPVDAMRVFLHEAVGHLGLRKLMGDDLKPLLNQVAALYPKQMAELSKEYNVDISTVEGKHEIAEEVLAHIAEQGTNRTIMQKLISLFRSLMRKIGFQLSLAEADIQNIIAMSRRVIEMDGMSVVGAIQPATLYSIRSSTAGKSNSRPEDTVTQGIKDGQPVDAVFRGLWNIAEVTQIPKLVRKTSAASLRGAMNFYDNHMGWAHPSMTYMAKGLIDQYGLSDEYKHLKASMASKKNGIIDEVRDIIETLQGMNVSDEDSNLIHEILVNEEPRQEAWDAITEPIRKRVEVLGQDAANLGLISQESYDRNKGMYLHRVYMKYEANKSAFQQWADNLSGKRTAKIKGQETMERGLSIFVKQDRILGDIGLEPDELEIGTRLYKNDKMSENGQKAIKTYYSLEPLDDSEYRIQEFTVRAKHAGRVKLHRDWTKQERVDMGQITDARYVLGKTFSLLAHDLSTGEFFQTISKNEAWTMPREEEAGMKKDIMSGEAALRAGVVTGAEWVRVPTTGIKKSQAMVYGALSGRVVRAEIFQDLNQLHKMQKNNWWKDILTAFKLNKTARNPVVHFNNIMSNLVLMDMADVRFSDLYRAIIEMRKKGDMYDEAKANGAFGASFAEHELKNEVLDKLIDEIHAATGVKPVGLEDVFLQMDRLPLNKQFAFMMKLLDGLWHGVDIKGRKVGLKNLDKKMLSYYQHEDEVFRMATYMRRRMQGMNVVEAGLSARDQFLNYDINAPWINAARATVLPFISYTYRAIPIVAKSIAQRPWKLAKYFTIAYGMNAIGYALSGGDEEKERKSLRDEVSGKLWIGSERMIRMAWNNEEGNPYFWDVRRLIPVGDVFDMNQYHAALPIVPASMMPSGPIAMGFEFMLNKTGFFGEEIVDPLADDAVIGTQKTLDWLWKSYGPSAPWIPYSYYWDKLAIAGTGGRDRLGRDYEVLPALASSFGIKIAPHDVSYGVALKAMEIERTVQAIRHRLSFLEKDYWQGKISKSKYQTTRGRYMNKLEGLNEKARELIR